MRGKINEERGEIRGDAEKSKDDFNSYENAEITLNGNS